MTIYKSYCFPHSFSSSILFSLPLCIWRVGSPHPNEDTRPGLEHHLRIYHFRSHHILVLLPGFMLSHFPFGWIVYWGLDLNIPAMICVSKGGRVELTLLTQAIKVLSYTYVQAIMEAVEEIQMSKKKKSSALMVAKYLPVSELIRHTVDTLLKWNRMKKQI